MGRTGLFSSLADALLWRRTSTLSDPAPLGPAMGAVLAAATAHAAWAYSRSNIEHEAVEAAIVAFSAEIVLWTVLSATCIGVATRAFRSPAKARDLIVRLGAADAPGVVMFLGLLPPLRQATALLALAGLWRLAAMYVALRAAGLGRAHGSCHCPEGSSSA